MFYHELKHENIDIVNQLIDELNLSEIELEEIFRESEKNEEVVRKLNEKMELQNEQKFKKLIPKYDLYGDEVEQKQLLKDFKTSTQILNL